MVIKQALINNYQLSTKNQKLLTAKSWIIPILEILQA